MYKLMHSFRIVILSQENTKKQIQNQLNNISYFSEAHLTVCLLGYDMHCFSRKGDGL